MIGLGDIISIGKGALGLAKGSWVKLAIVAAMFSALLAWDYIRVDNAYKLGVAETEIKNNKANKLAALAQAKIDSDALLDIANKLASATTKAERDRAEAKRLQEILDKKPEVSPNDILQATSQPNCSIMCAVNFELWKRITKKPDGLRYRN